VRRRRHDDDDHHHHLIINIITSITAHEDMKTVMQEKVLDA
jgi:hypothetical protein